MDYFSINRELETAFKIEYGFISNLNNKFYGSTFYKNLYYIKVSNIAEKKYSKEMNKNFNKITIRKYLGQRIL